MQTLPIKVLAFDVFGTVVDYYTSIRQEGQELNKARGLAVDWGRFALAWRGRYRPSMEKVARGEVPWSNLDALHRASLEEVLAEFGLEGEFNQAEKERLNRVWHRLLPWPEAVEGLTRLRRNFLLSTLSNGNVALLVNMAKHSGLPWDYIYSAEIAKAYKPDPAAYLTLVKLLDLQPAEVILVAAHVDDLEAAQAVGLRTAFVHRPLEAGPDNPSKPPTGENFDFRATDFVDLARQLEISA